MGCNCSKKSVQTSTEKQTQAALTKASQSLGTGKVYVRKSSGTMGIKKSS